MKYNKFFLTGTAICTFSKKYPGTKFIFISMIITIQALPYPEELTLNQEEPPTQKEVNLFTYIQNFKHIISDYVNAQYRLSSEELEKVTVILEGFLKKLATDLKEVMDKNGEDWEEKNFDDGLPDEKFEEVKRRVVEEFSDIKEKTAEEMVYRLRKNLYETRHKLDEIIKASDKPDKLIIAETETDE